MAHGAEATVGAEALEAGSPRGGWRNAGLPRPGKLESLGGRFPGRGGERSLRGACWKRRYEAVCAAAAVATCLITTPLWNLAKRPAGTGGVPLIHAFLMWPALSIGLWFVLMLWHRTDRAVLGDAGFTKLFGSGVAAMFVGRMAYGLSAPDGVEAELVPPRDLYTFNYVAGLYYVMLFAWYFWLPGIWYWREFWRCISCRRRADVAPWSRSLPMSIASIGVIVYGTFGQVLESIVGWQLVRWGPAALVGWFIALVADRGKDFYNDAGYKLMLSFMVLGIPVGLGAFMLKIIDAARSSPLGQILAVGSFQAVIGMCYLCWRLTSAKAVGDADSSRPYDLLFVWALELFSETLFMDIVPLSVQFFFIVAIQRAKDITIHSGVLRHVGERLLDRCAGTSVGRARQVRPKTAAERAKNLYLHWHHQVRSKRAIQLCLQLDSSRRSSHPQELVLFADVLATVVVSLALMMEYASVDAGFGIYMLSARTVQYGRAPMLLSYLFILVTQLVSAVVARRIMHRRLDAMRATALSATRVAAPSGTATTDVSDNITVVNPMIAMRGSPLETPPAPAQAQPAGTKAAPSMNGTAEARRGGSMTTAARTAKGTQAGRSGGARRGRRISMLDTGTDWNAAASLEAFWSRHWKDFAAMLLYGTTLSMRYIYDIKAVDLANMIETGIANATGTDLVS